jgi:hypothetical protein
VLEALEGGEELAQSSFMTRSMPKIGADRLDEPVLPGDDRAAKTIQEFTTLPGRRWAVSQEGSSLFFETIP